MHVIYASMLFFFKMVLEHLFNQCKIRLFTQKFCHLESWNICVGSDLLSCQMGNWPLDPHCACWLTQQMAMSASMPSPFLSRAAAEIQKLPSYYGRKPVNDLALDIILWIVEISIIIHNLAFLHTFT